MCPQEEVSESHTAFTHVLIIACIIKTDKLVSIDLRLDIRLNKPFLFLSVDDILTVLAALLTEQRLIISSSHYSLPGFIVQVREWWFRQQLKIPHSRDTRVRPLVRLHHFMLDHSWSVVGPWGCLVSSKLNSLVVVIMYTNLGIYKHCCFKHTQCLQRLPMCCYLF